MPKHRKNAAADTMRRLNAEGRGVYKVAIVFPHEGPDLLAAALAGDGVALAEFTLIMQGIDLVKTARPPLLCLLCDHEFSGHLPAAFVVMTGHVDDPTAGLVNGLCRKCAAGGDLTGRVAGKYRTEMIPDLRVLPEFSEPGRA
jgi:hypothetical protein